MLRPSCHTVLACVALIGCSDAAQPAEPAKRCDAKEFRAFDFWVGEWRVTWKTPQGQPAEGRSSIQRVVGGCAIEEHWQGGDGSEGKSFTFFNPATRHWQQTWVDATAQPLMFEGNFEGVRTAVATSTHSIPRNTWFNAQVARTGNQTDIKINGITVILNVQQSELRSGTVGVITHWTKGHFDNVSLTDRPNRPPTELTEL